MVRGLLIALALLVLFPARDAGAAGPIGDLIAETGALLLPVRIERAFLLSLHAAADALHEGDVPRAQTSLRTFAFEVRSVKRAKRIPADTADRLIEKVEKLIATMTAPAPR